MSNPIEDYALIGDGETAALVSRSGSVDWLCWPAFDNDSCFAALLGTPEHGCWRLHPTAAVQRTSRRYQADTLVLETDLQTQDGAVRLLDFMPERQGFSSLVRIVVGLRGRVGMRSELRMRFDYGSLPPWCQAVGDGAVAGSGRIPPCSAPRFRSSCAKAASSRMACASRPMAGRSTCPTRRFRLTRYPGRKPAARMRSKRSTWRLMAACQAGASFATPTMAIRTGSP